MDASNTRPWAVKPDEKLYSHLSHKQRMIQSFPYKPADPELAKDRLRARKILKEFNNADPENEDNRRSLLRQLFHPSCADKKIYLEPNFRVDYGYNIKVGNNLQVNYDCCILDCAPVEIGDNCLMAPSVHIYAATHPLDAKHRKDDDDYYELAYPVKIGNNVWIGGHVSILPNVTIGDNVVVGAGSVVTKDIPSNVVVAGNPAKIIRKV